LEGVESLRKILLLPIGFILMFSFMVSLPIKADGKNHQVSIGKSVSDNGITFTINRYEKKNGELFINYTVTSNSVLRENRIGNHLMEKPRFFINGKRLDVLFDSNQTLINQNKFTGYISISLTDIKSKYNNFTFQVNNISGQSGNWKVNFPI
jgi:hypothetical protein